MKKYFVATLILLFTISFGQNVNIYKYALVPAKFSFLREADQYQLNSLTKFLMDKEGFETYIETDELPEDFVNNNCNKVFVDVESSGGMFGMKLKVILKDCKNNVLFASEIGKSKEKDYKKGYQEALREAFKSFNTLHYVYTPSATNAVVKETAVVAPVAVVPIATSVNNTAVATNPSVKMEGEVLFAQPIVNGFQLIDSSPKVIMKIYNTSDKNTFIAIKGSAQGIFITKDNQWFFEYYQNDKLVSEKVAVKF